MKKLTRLILYNLFNNGPIILKLNTLCIEGLKTFCETFSSLTLEDTKWWHNEKLFNFRLRKNYFYELVPVMKGCTTGVGRVVNGGSKDGRCLRRASPSYWDQLQSIIWSANLLQFVNVCYKCGKFGERLSCRSYRTKPKYFDIGDESMREELNSISVRYIRLLPWRKTQHDLAP